MQNYDFSNTKHIVKFFEKHYKEAKIFYFENPNQNFSFLILKT